MKKNIAVLVLALLLAGLLVVTSCSLNIGDILQGIAQGQEDPADTGAEDPGGDPAGPGDNGEEPGEDIDSGEDSDDHGDSTSGAFTLFPAALDMPVGRRINLVADNGNNVVSWSSSNPGVATVS